MSAEPIIDELEWRGLIYQASDLELIRKRSTAAPLVVYVGFDPSADSLHVGNLVPLLTLRRFQLAGHTAIGLVGGGTGLIGDPSGKSAERDLSTYDLVVQRVASIRAQIERMLQPGAGAPEPIIVDNRDWLDAMSAIGFLRDVGKHFTVNWMMAKESVSARFAQGGGLSFTEFSYMLLQALDYRELYHRHDCRLQVGGSDQWGNITAGMELVRRKDGAEVEGLTLPLITTASGQKLGKTESGSVWLDARKTSPYAFFQYWLATDDRDAGAYLRYFTFLPREEIERLDETVQVAPQRREAQTRLAYEVTALIHGEEAARQSQYISAALFGTADLDDLTLEMLEQARDSIPSLELASDSDTPPVADLLAATGLASSKSEARRFVESGGAYLNNRRWEEALSAPGPDDFLLGRFLVLRRGKRNVALVHRARSRR